MSSSQTYPWNEFPYQTIQRASVIRGCSQSQIYADLRSGELTGVKLGGKTLVATESLVAALKKARPWTPDRNRVAKANEARVERRKAEREAALKPTPGRVARRRKEREAATPP